MLEDGTISLDCSHATPLQNCCCEGAVLYLWTRQLSDQVKSRIAGKSIKDPEGLKEVLKIADAVHTTNSQRAHQVVAVKSSRQGGATQARPDGASAQSIQNWGLRHPDNPPDGCCQVHWRWDTKAYFCNNIANCPLVDTKAYFSSNIANCPWVKGSSRGRNRNRMSEIHRIDRRETHHRSWGTHRGHGGRTIRQQQTQVCPLLIL